MSSFKRIKFLIGLQYQLMKKWIFNNFLSNLFRSKIFKLRGHCTFGSTKSSLFSNYNEVSLECNTLEIINVFGINCIFKLNEERLTDEVLINSINPFDEMMKNSSSIFSGGSQSKRGRL